MAALLLRGPNDAWFPALRTAPAHTRDPEELACFLMAPWCNRIADARFVFRDTSHSLQPNSADHTAIHGDLRQRSFSILDRSPCSARLACDARDPHHRNWPWPYRAIARFEIDENTFSCELAVTNAAHEPMPVGLGFHPFWPRRLWDERDDVQIHAPCQARYPLARNIPTGPPSDDALAQSLRAGMPVGSQALDDVFVGSLDGASISWAASGILARFACSPLLSHAVLFTPLNQHSGALPWFCLEPASMVNDGFNLMHRGISGTGARVLAPGESMLAKWSLRFDVLPISSASRPKLLP